ncbi:hypothetical protein L7F22_009474 [Adiantum nelumboides]|nr:hypothetical protein [Adiantum nelumboides]
MAPRKPSQNVWDSTLHVARYGTSGSRVVLCKFCGDVLRRSLTRVTRHFTWVMGVGGHGCERVPESMFYAYGGAETRWQEVNSKLRSPLPQNLIDEKLARAIQEESLTKEARDAKKRAREELQEVHEESYSTQAPTPIANVSGGQEGGCSSTPGASSHMDESNLLHQLSLLHKFMRMSDRDYFARPIALKEESKQQAVSWWEINGRLTPTLQRLALRTLSQECTSGAAERIWSICADIHTRKRNRLSTSQLGKLVYVNANLRLLERLRLRDGNGEGVLQWKVKDIDASVVANLERGLARGEAIDITFIQQRSDEDLAYDFLREEQTRFRRVTRAQARALQLPTEPPTMDAGVGPSTCGRSTLARGGRRGRGGRATRSSLVMREMIPSDESASSSSSTHSEMDAASYSDFVSE